MNRSRWCCVGVAALVFVAGLGALTEPCTITVQPGESIQAAIDAASPGDVICLSPGEWEENLLIEKRLTLRAAGTESEPLALIRSAREDWPVIRISSEEPIDVTIQGLKITGAFGDCYKGAPEWICAFGISVHGKATAVIENNTISDNGDGIGMWDSSQATIDNNTITDNDWHGIGMWDSSQATVDNNTITGNDWHGIGMRDSSQATIESNAISGNRYGIRMVDSSQATVENNVISDNNELGIGMWDSSQATIKDSTIQGNTREGISLLDSAQATVENNAISGNGRGIYMWRSSQATIEDNTISGNIFGIEMGHSSQATVDNNTITGNDWHGIGMRDSSQATITGNVIQGNERYGVALYERPCYDTSRMFTGSVIGSGNTGGGNAEGDYCPDDLAFLFTEEGGELDRRR